MSYGICIQNIKNLIKRVCYDDFIQYLLTIKGQKYQTLATEIWHFWTWSRLAQMIFISPTNLVGEINFHLPNWNFHLPNFLLHFNKNFCVFVNYLLLAFFFQKKYLNGKEKLMKWLNFFPTKFSIMINHKSLTREYYWVTKSFLQNFDLY